MMTILMDNTSLAKTNKKDDLGKNKYNDLFNFFDALEVIRNFITRKIHSLASIKASLT